MALREKGITRVLEKLVAAINAGQYYEAHQMYRTLYFRYLSLKKYAELLQLLESGAMVLLDHGQQGSGSDLAILLLDVLIKSETKPCEEWIEKIAKLFEKINLDMPEREIFLINAVKWSMGNNKKGHPLLHQRIAEVYWREKKFTSSHRHFMQSSDGVAYATMLIELHTTSGDKSEIGLFITQAVLQILCLKNMKLAKDTFIEYTKSHPSIQNKGPPYSNPLLNFSSFILKAIEDNNFKKFQFFRKSYDKFLKRDTSYVEYLNTIARVWFGISAPGHKNATSMINGLMKTFFGDIDISDGDSSNLAKRANVPDLD